MFLLIIAIVLWFSQNFQDYLALLQGIKMQLFRAAVLYS